MAMIGMTEHEKDAFSITRAVRALAFPQNRQYQREAEFEFDVSTEAAKIEKRDIGGIFIPEDVTKHKMVNRRMLTAGSNTGGGYTVDDELQSIIDIFLENNFAADNATVMSGLQGNVDIPGQDDRIVAQFVGETEAATEDEPTFRQISLTPRHCKTYLRVSKQLLVQSHESIEMFLRRDLSRAIAKKVDKSILYGVGSAGDTVYDFDMAEYAAVANVTEFNALTGKKWSFVTISGTKYMVFNDIVTADETALKLLKAGSQIVISHSNAEVETVTVSAAYDDTNDRIAIADYDTTDLTGGTSYDITAVTVAATFEPPGIVNTSGIHNYTWRNTDTHRAEDLIERVLEMEEILAANNVPGVNSTLDMQVQNCKFLLSNRVKRLMKNVKFFGNNTEFPLLPDDNEKILGEYDWDCSTQVNLGDFFFCDWKETILGLWSGIEIMENPYTEDTKGIIRIVADQMLDVNVSRPTSMAYAKVA